MGRSVLWFGFLFLVVILKTEEAFTEAQKQQANKPKLLKQSVVDEVNSNLDAGWVATIHPHMAQYEEEDFSSLLGAVIPENIQKKYKIHDTYSDPVLPENFTLPKSYNTLTAFPQCDKIIGLIRDQGRCGSCWAFAVTGMLQDRFCIRYNKTVVLSPNELLACCETCSRDCGGGLPDMALTYIFQNGIHTEECYPYFDQGGCKGHGCRVSPVKPHCVRTCQPNSNQSWSDNSTKYWADDYFVFDPTPHGMMYDIYLHGPQLAAMDVYADFPHYQSGVYRHVTGKWLGRHAVRIVGWGTSDDGVDYWLVANSWSPKWGEKGFFRIRKGTNENNIEQLLVLSVYPSLECLDN